MGHQKRSKLKKSSQTLSDENCNSESESLPDDNDDYHCESDDNSESDDMDVHSKAHVNELLNEISTNQLLKTLKRKLSKTKSTGEENMKKKKSEPLELDNDFMINQALYEIIHKDQFLNCLK